MKHKIILIFLLTILIFTNCNGQNSELTDLIINKRELKISDFTAIKKVRYFPYGDEEDELIEKKVKAYRVLDLKKANLLGVNGTALYLVAKKGKVQDFWLRIEGIDNVKKLYEKIESKYPDMTSYNDGTLRFKHFYNDNEVLEITINDLMPSDVFMDILFTNNYENTSCNMFKHYDQNINRKPKKINFKYNSETKTYEIERI